MSFTLMRYKDGKPAPIKMTIWDAFKGAPPPKPRAHKCPTCNTIHKPGTKHDVHPEADADKPKDEEKKGDEQGKKPNKPADAVDSGFTAEEDAKIVELKANGRTWAQIAQELGGGRTKGDITHRYKQVTTNQKSEEKDHAKKDENKEKKHDEKAQHQMSNKEKKRAAKAEKDREEGLKKKEEAAKAKDGETSKAAEEVKEPVAEAESTKPPADAAGKAGRTTTTDVKPPEVKNDKQKWIVAASKHFDRTGQRITPAQAQKMAEEKST